MDVTMKVLYMNIILETHHMIFDDSARSERRLDELRRMMSVVWESSSDVIAISVRGATNGEITTMVSPTYLKLCDVRHTNSTNETGKNNFPDGKNNESNVGERAKAIIFELDAEDISLARNKRDIRNSLDAPPAPANVSDDSVLLGLASPLARSKSIGLKSSINTTNKHRNRKIVPKTAYSVEFSKGISTIREGLKHSNTTSQDYTDETSKEIPPPQKPTELISSMANLIVRAWESSGSNILLMHDLICLDGQIEVEKATISCEANVTRLDKNSLVVVMRNVSERFQRFNTEKQLVSETTARLKDAEANRFTRHEVKNGLLAAIGLCESLRDTFNLNAKKSLSMDNLKIQKKSSEGKVLSELDKTLHEVLDTILAEAMARDVIHDCYKPKIERVNINALMSRGLEKQNERFPLATDPSPMPMLMLDQQLLKYIYRNAISNACKYGKKGGAVTTTAKFDKNTGLLNVTVINLPGENYDKILNMGDEAKEAVFSPGRRLNNDILKDKSSKLISHSSGDGAWIMRKCANTLGGDCDIKFEPKRTVFLFSCPAETFEDAMKLSHSGDKVKFHIPPESWGIAIDDSKVQRKLLKRFLKIAGISESRSIVQGETAEEIHNFDDFVIQLIDQHPNDYFLLIVDENLDIMEDSTHSVTVSGSLCIESIRRQILPEQERRLLALVRSANDSAQDVALYNSRAHGFLPKAPLRKENIKNDSAQDVALYNSRAHGFLPKAPLRKENIIETLAMLWEKRHMFTQPMPPEDPSVSTSSTYDENDKSKEIQEIMQLVTSIDEICTKDEAYLDEQW
eukprot:CAMPEP_0194349780 /NCGR_PEP_ID=MMETSP0171-20130528/107281_1 /TAXON_ID=218684 /ORGANISM="Corethron pennatum, Strain L29A3" /LENGTH=800 /DNA_ID=CAMNT_0039117273 /DNA_START=44 /DNA_END=2444 /DNA_ORIENTATION=+